ncbi:MAG: homocysteine S-methyltransferase family protein [Clostridia bacterium]|nr:homocysteine S-methyltransferase family protein [Clostridia bacterium]
MDIRSKLTKGLLYFDGGTGTVLQSMGLPAGASPETWNIEHPGRITALHRAYYEAGCDIVKANTFGANRFKFDGQDGRYDLKTVIDAALQNAKAARECVAGDGRERYIALDIGASGKLLQPLGDLPFEDAVAVFAEVVRLGAAAGADLVLIETMSDAYETKAAVLAAKENSTLPVFVTNVYDEQARLMTGASPEAMAAMLEGLRVDAIGVNCGFGPKPMKEIVRRLADATSLPVIVNPNAGLPRVAKEGATVFDVEPDEFAADMADMVALGARVLGGCCGTTPEYIRAVADRTRGLSPRPLTPKMRTVVSSYTHTVEIGERPTLIGERINPTGKPKLKQALRDGDMEFVLNEALGQRDCGADILDVNVGLPELDEPAVMARCIRAIQGVVSLPLQIDTSDPVAMETAMRLYNGKPLVNSVNGKKESMEAVFPLLAKYGGVVIALTLDENGIPDTAEGRIEIARRIRDTAAEYGISSSDIVVDPLAMAVSVDGNAARVTLDAIAGIRERLGLHTSLGVSNVSFGLPNREAVNAAFYDTALAHGLNAAILNPFSAPMIAVAGQAAQNGAGDRVSTYEAFTKQVTEQAAPPTYTPAEQKQFTLRDTIVRGLKGQAARLTQECLESVSPLDVIDQHIIPALDEVGRGFEKKTVFLPQLLASAEAAQAAFEVIRAFYESSGTVQEKKGLVVLCTVEGDIHDIGKNIVRVLLENYGFEVVDLGRDVPCQRVADEAAARNAKLVGLSALMTTTVPAMERTIRCVRKALPDCKIIVGGAVLTQEYADQIGADAYGRDAMETVRYAEQVFASANE